MPLYAYRCTQCGHHFEKRQNFSTKPETQCPICQGILVRPLTAPGLSFKGKGFYVNDYASKSSAPASESAPVETKTPAPCAGDCAACPAAAPAAASATG